LLHPLLHCVPLKVFVEKAHYIRGMVALREIRAGAGGRGLGLLPRCGWGLCCAGGLRGWDSRGGLPVTPANFGMRTREKSLALGS